MVKIMRIFVVMTLLLVTMAAPALGKGPDQQVPIKGTVLGEHGPPDFSAPDCPGWAEWRYSSEGEGHMSHLGKVEYHLTQCTVSGPVTTSEGNITFVAANGDELWLEHTMFGQMVGTMDHPDGFLFDRRVDGCRWDRHGSPMRAVLAICTGLAILDEIVDPDVPPWLMQTNFEGDIAYKRK